MLVEGVTEVVELLFEASEGFLIPSHEKQVM